MTGGLRGDTRGDTKKAAAAEGPRQADVYQQAPGWGESDPPALRVPAALGDPFNRSRASVHLTPFYNASCPRQTQPQGASTLNKAN